jgi:hypothetical protein
VDAFKDVPAGSLMDSASENALDIQTAMEYFAAIFEMNTGGFSELGKFSRLLKTLQGAVKGEAAEAKTDEK